ncbi:MAG: XdhC family protein [Thiohalobacterales bacterium]|nr:XdhC family protein [Thiohalobacterales bacterium]
MTTTPFEGLNMHLGLSQLLSFLERHQDAPHLVLVTVVAVEGSSYRKPGALMLIGPDDTFQGMVSGGCLEQDLALRARDVFDSGRATRFTYDLRDEDQAPWGLGLGCNGVIHLMLQRLDRDSGFGFLPFLSSSLGKRHSCALHLVTASTDSDIDLGSFAISSQAGDFHTDCDALAPQQLQQAAWQAKGRSAIAELIVGDGAIELLRVMIEPSPRILVCGGGPDAVPLAAQVRSLGWECVVIDHRPAYAEPGRFADGVEVITARPGDLGRHVDLAEISAAMVMSHNLDHDHAYLEQLLKADLAYTGVLGPAHRRERLIMRGSCPG